MAANTTTNQQAPADDGVPLATLGRGPDKQLRIRLKEYQGHRYIDVREWALSKDGAFWFPTKKGGSIRTRELEHVIEALEKARELSR